MKRIGLVAVLMLHGSSAHAGNSFSFSVGGRQIHIESSRHCRSTSCASVSITGIHDSHRRDDDGDSDNSAVKTPSQDTSSTQPAPVGNVPAPLAIAAPPPSLLKPAATVTQIVPAPSPPVQPATVTPPLPLPPLPPVEQTSEAAPPAPVAQVSTASRDGEDGPADGPVGDWQTEGKGLVRIVKCGNALCGFVLNLPSNDRGEAVLVNMKPQTDMRWAGNVYSRSSGDSYYGTMAMSDANSLRVEACAFGRFYCTGNVWTRITGKAERITSRQNSPQPRS
jgi:uncharacterized protein (DUF2147 family)